MEAVLNEGTFNLVRSSPTALFRSHRSFAERGVSVCQRCVELAELDLQKAQTLGGRMTQRRCANLHEAVLKQEHLNIF